MKKILLCFLVSASLIACTSPATKSETATTSSTVNKTDLESRLKEMESSWNLSILDKDRGVKFNDDLLANDFSGFSDKGVKQGKAEVLLSLNDTKGIINSVVNGDMSVTFYGDNVASIVGSHVTKGKDEAGKDYTKTTNWTDTFMERNGKWQCIASGSSSHF
ncbi:MAG: nuclear transport factor 2 family protein [Bacteroidetes bacterium]|nr:nuclear transport factor 2 family protein [Bacteroidota bacterium]